jgi:hypothetical protein
METSWHIGVALELAVTKTRGCASTDSADATRIGRSWRPDHVVQQRSLTSTGSLALTCANLPAITSSGGMWGMVWGGLRHGPRSQHYLLAWIQHTRGLQNLGCRLRCRRVRSSRACAHYSACLYEAKVDASEPSPACRRKRPSGDTRSLTIRQQYVSVALESACHL